LRRGLRDCGAANAGAFSHRHKNRWDSIKIKILLPILLALALFTTGYAQTLDIAKLDQFFDRLAEKNKAMGSLAFRLVCFGSH
jgi:hypothetical protein